MAYAIVVVGTSWGGLAAARELIKSLPEAFGLPLVLVQHRHKQSDGLTTLLQASTSLCVSEVDDKAPIAPGNIYVAPADYHLLVEDGYFSLSIDGPVHFSRPSIDVTFQSAADVYGERSVGVVLTGANTDGSRGLRRISDRGGLALVQQPSTAESPTMPAAAIAHVPQAKVLTIEEIASILGGLPADSVSATTQSPDRR